MHIIQKDHLIKKCVSLLIASSLFSGCVCGLISATDTTRVEQKITPTNTTHSDPEDIPLSPEQNRSFTLTHHGLDGNRVLAGTGSEYIESIDITLQGKPIWIVASAIQQYSNWYVILENGQVQAFRVTSNSVQELHPSISSLPSGMPLY